MSDYGRWSDWVAKPIKQDIGVSEQVDRLRFQAELCYSIARSLPGIAEQAEAARICNDVNLAADWLSKHEDAINAGRPGNAPDPTHFEPRQTDSDHVYAKQWAKQAKANEAQRQQNANDIFRQIADLGGKPTPILNARRKAVLDYERERYSPPIYDTSLIPQPPPPPTEEPDLGDN